MVTEGLPLEARADLGADNCKQRREDRVRAHALAGMGPCRETWGWGEPSRRGCRDAIPRYPSNGVPLSKSRLRMAIPRRPFGAFPSVCGAQGPTHRLRPVWWVPGYRVWGAPQRWGTVAGSGLAQSSMLMMMTMMMMIIIMGSA